MPDRIEWQIDFEHRRPTSEEIDDALRRLGRPKRIRVSPLLFVELAAQTGPRLERAGVLPRCEVVVDMDYDGYVIAKGPVAAVERARVPEGPYA